MPPMQNIEQITRSGRTSVNCAANVLRISISRADEERSRQPLDELPWVLALPVAAEVMLRPPIGPVRCAHPPAKRGTGGVDVERDGVLGEDGDRMTALNEAAGRAQLRWHIASAVNQSKQVMANPHRTLR
jgi:hypothetical protein